MILTIYVIGIPLFPFIIMLALKYLPHNIDFENNFVRVAFHTFLSILWPVVLIIGLLSIIYYKFYQMINTIDKHKRQ